MRFSSLFAAASLNFLAVNRFFAPDPAVGQIFVLFIMGLAAAEVAKAARRRGGGGHGHGGMGMPAEKSLDFFGSGRRLLGRLAPVRLQVIAAVALRGVTGSGRKAAIGCREGEEQ